MLADTHLKMPLDYYIALLPGVGGNLYLAGLSRLAVFTANVKRLGNTVAECGGEIVIGHAVRLFYSLTLAAAGNGIRFKRRAASLYYIRNVYVEGQRTAVYERKAEVAQTVLAICILALAYAGIFRHILYGQVLNFAQFPYSARHFPDLRIKTRNFLHLIIPPFYRDEKSPSQR